MGQTTGPILAVGAITIFNQTVLNSKPIDWRIPIATGFLAGGFSILEKANPQFAKGIAWIALITVLIARVDPRTPAPIETLLKYWNGGKK
jgi:hypothetical protein